MMNARHLGENLFSEAQQSSGHAALESSVHSSLSLPTLLFTLLGTLDVPLTLAGLHHGGHELNPLARALLAHGETTFAAVRVVSLLAAGFLLALFAPSAPRLARGCAWALALLFALVDLASILQLVIL